MNQEDAEGKEGQTKNKRKRSAFELGQFVPQRLLRPPEPEAVGSNPALPNFIPYTVITYSPQFPLWGTGLLSQCDKIVTNLRSQEVP